MTQKQKFLLKEKIKNFREIYCPGKNSIFYKEHKNIKFARFYRELGESFDIDKESLDTQNKLILLLVNYIHQWDDLIDEKNISVNVAKELSIPNLKTENIFVDLNKEIKNKLSTKQIQNLRELLLLNREKELNLVNQLQISTNQYVKIRNKHVEIIENYFNNEKTFVKNKATKNLVIKMLQEGNCDFYLYNSIFYLFLSPFDIKILDLFLKNYLVIDLFLDHIVDLKDDLKYNAFNTLSWFYESTSREKLNSLSFDNQLKEAHVYDIFLTKIKDFENNALFFLDSMTNKKLYKLLKYYLEGEVKGLKIFKEYNYFIDLPYNERQKMKEAILKPYPWSVKL